MRLYGYLKSASLYWLLIGTIIVVFGAFKEGELSLLYLFAVLIFWGLIVGLPSFVLMEVGRRLEIRSQKKPSNNEKEKV